MEENKNSLKQENMDLSGKKISKNYVEQERQIPLLIDEINSAEKSTEEVNRHFPPNISSARNNLENAKQEEEIPNSKNIADEKAPITDKVSEAAQNIEEGAKSAMEIVREKLERISETETAHQIKDKLSTTLEKTMEAGEAMQKAASVAASAVAEKISQNLTANNIANIYHNIIEKEREIIEKVTSSEFREDIQEKASHFIEATQENANYVWCAAKERVNNMVEMVNDNTLAEKVKLVTSNVTETIKESASKLTNPETRENITEAIKENAAMIKDAMAATLSTVKDKIESGLTTQLSPPNDNTEDNLTKIEDTPPLNENIEVNQKKEKHKVNIKDDSEEDDDLGAYGASK